MDAVPAAGPPGSNVVWLITSVVTGVGLLSYPIAWIVMPEEPYMLASQAPGGQQVANS